MVACKGVGQVHLSEVATARSRCSIMGVFTELESTVTESRCHVI